MTSDALYLLSTCWYTRCSVLDCRESYRTRMSAVTKGSSHRRHRSCILWSLPYIILKWHKRCVTLGVTDTTYLCLKLNWHSLSKLRHELKRHDTLSVTLTEPMQHGNRDLNLNDRREYLWIGRNEHRTSVTETGLLRYSSCRFEWNDIMQYLA